ncbi:MAG TPA: hypothetical protein VF101_03950 [Gaiellaceae bacterium]
MSRRDRRLRVAAFAAVALVVAAAVAGVALIRAGGGESARSERMREARLLLKNAMAPGRIDKIGDGEADRAGLNTPAAEDYENRAFPNATIDFAQTQNAIKDARQLLKHTGTRFPQAWDAAGPETLNVDTFGTQTFGPPTQWSGRVTALAVDPKCSTNACRIYVAAAGGGVWRSNNVLSPNPNWKQISDNGIPTNAIGSLYIDPTDSTGRTIYAGTGEGNGSSDSEAGLGLYKSTNAGESWSLVPGSESVAKDRAIAAIAVDPANASHILIGTAVARHGLSSKSGGRFTPPGAPQIGLYESKDGGASFALTLNRPQDPVNPTSANGGDFFRGGISHIEYDPASAGTFYASMFGYGLFRSTDNGATFDQIYTDTLSATDLLSVRYEFATAKLPNGKTRIYLGVGNQSDAAGNPTSILSELYRVDDARAAGLTNAGWTKLSSSTNGTPGFGAYNFCQTQCSYDMFVASPAGRPDEVVLGGSMNYGELPPYGGADRSNGRGVVMSTDAGVNWFDMTGDARHSSDGILFHDEDMHPDQHAIGFVPTNPDLFFVGSDGGVIRTNGQFTDDSADCANRGLSGDDLVDCQHWLSKVPNRLVTLNSGLNTLQFQSIAVDPNNPLTRAFGGTQDNGTLAYTGSDTWLLPVTGDGGDAGIDSVNPNIWFHTYTNDFVDVNFNGPTPATWDWIGDPIFFAPEADAFYAPMTQDPVREGQIFAGLGHVWRTQDSGGDPTFLDNHCNTTGVLGKSDKLFTGECGDWVPLGGTAGAADAGNLIVGPSSDKGGSYVVAIARAQDANTMWVGTRRGRIFVSQNASAANPLDVTYTRIDTPAQPRRYPSGISVDPTDPNHAVISFSGYNAYTPTTPGHVFDVHFNPGAGTASWTDISYDLGDQPVLDVAFDKATGDVYASTDFGVDRLADGTTTWIPAADGMPPVAVYDLTLVGGGKTDRLLYAGTHGRGVYRLELPKGK